jgi:CRP/FNR family cyclic AMP-dependent transcriptional regulator
MANKPTTPFLDIGAIVSILQRITLFGGLTENQLATVFKQLEGVSYRAGETIFEQGSTASGIYVILSGRVKMVARMDDTPMELVEYQQGQCFGETSAIGILPHSATAHVMEPTELIVLSSRALHTLYHEDPSLFGLLILNIAREACRRLNKTDQIMLHYASAKVSHPI